jgi:hypothetical protein
MEEIRLWKIDGSEQEYQITPVPNAAQTKTEEMLEGILVKLPDLLFEELTLVGRQVETPGGPLDLLGVDEEGQLVVFELKRGTLTRDAVAQVIDYASYLAELSPPALSECITSASGKNGIAPIESFEAWYEDEFGGKTIESIGKPRMVLVGLGVDDRTRRMVEFLANRNVDISLITFHGFTDSNGTYLAKQVEVAQKPTTQTSRGSKQANLQALAQRIEKANLGKYFTDVVQFLRTELKNTYEWPSPRGYGYYFSEVTDAGTPTNRAYLGIFILSNPNGALNLTVQERAAQAAGPEWTHFRQNWGTAVTQHRGYYDVRIQTEQDWKTMSPDVKALCAAILNGQKAMQEQRANAERQNLEKSVKAEGSAMDPSTLPIG